jgi:hypothetical protein
MRRSTGKNPKVKRDRGFIMSSASYTRMGNDFRTWAGSASHLFGASIVLRREQENEERRVLEASTAAGVVSVALNTGGAQRLLTAFALEALLKAVWLKSGRELVRDGRYAGLPCEQKKKWHDLAAICDDAGVSLTPSEREVLLRLSDCSRYQGRYPVSRHWENMEPIFYWSSEWDVAIGRLVTRAWKSLGIPIRGVPIGGAPLPVER